MAVIFTEHPVEMVLNGQIRQLEIERKIVAKISPDRRALIQKLSRIWENASVGSIGNAQLIDEAKAVIGSLNDSVAAATQQGLKSSSEPGQLFSADSSSDDVFDISDFFDLLDEAGLTNAVVASMLERHVAEFSLKLSDDYKAEVHGLSNMGHEHRDVARRLAKLHSRWDTGEISTRELIEETAFVIANVRMHQKRAQLQTDASNEMLAKEQPLQIRQVSRRVWTQPNIQPVVVMVDSSMVKSIDELVSSFRAFDNGVRRPIYFLADSDKTMLAVKKQTARAKLLNNSYSVEPALFKGERKYKTYRLSLAELEARLIRLEMPDSPIASLIHPSDMSIDPNGLSEPSIFDGALIFAINDAMQATISSLRSLQGIEKHLREIYRQA